MKLLLLKGWSLVGVALTTLAVGVVLGAPAPGPAPQTNEIIVEGSPAYNTLLQQQRAWDKQLRLQSIQDYVLSTLGRGKVPSTPVGSSQAGLPSQPTVSPFSGEMKTFTASCDTPNRVDEAVWTDPSYFHLFFKFPTPSRHPQNVTGNNSTSDSTISKTASTLPKKPFTTISAKLRIFKVGQNAQNETFDEAFGTTTPLSPTPSSATGVAGESVLAVVEEKIRVSVYWYKAPVTKTHYKKKLLDTRMISVKGSSWVEFDIINAAIPWLDRQDKNFGLVIEVENEDNDPLNPFDYFANLVCPGNSSNTSNPAFLKLSPPPQLQLCILNTPHHQREVDTTQSPAVPFPHQMSQSFSVLSRMAKAHEQQRAAASNATNSGPTPTYNTDWQNDDLPPTQGHKVTNRNHRHRHGHGTPKNGKKVPQSGSSLNGSPTMSTPTGFQLDEDHPLRRILATAATNVHNSNGHVHSRRCHHDQEGHDQYDLSSDLDDSLETDRDVIIQKIYLRGGHASSSQQQGEEKER